jgi:hypothetical protein
MDMFGIINNVLWIDKMKDGWNGTFGNNFYLTWIIVELMSKWIKLWRKFSVY